MSKKFSCKDDKGSSEYVESVNAWYSSKRGYITRQLPLSRSADQVLYNQRIDNLALQ